MTVLELMASILVIAVFAGFLLNALLQAEEMTERAGVQMTVMNLRSVLRLQIANYVIAGREAELSQLVGANPVRWMEPPPGYLGEVTGAKEGEMKSGTWHFDSDRREVVYLPQGRTGFKPLPGGKHVLRWRIQAGAPSGMMHGIDLVAVEEIAWFGVPLR
jgi:hypothetical protein